MQCTSTRLTRAVLTEGLVLTAILTVVRNILNLLLIFSCLRRLQVLVVIHILVVLGDHVLWHDLMRVDPLALTIQEILLVLIHLNIVHIVHLRHLLEHLLLVILRHLHLRCVVVLLVILLRLLL